MLKKYSLLGYPPTEELKFLNSRQLLHWVRVEYDISMMYIRAFLKESFTISRGFPFVMEFWPHGMSGSESFNLIKKILFSSPYKYFYDLNDQSMNKIDLNEENLEYLFKKLSNDFNHTDILLSTK